MPCAPRTAVSKRMRCAKTFFTTPSSISCSKSGTNMSNRLALSPLKNGENALCSELMSDAYNEQLQATHRSRKSASIFENFVDPGPVDWQSFSKN
jgi:hypothetical protein